MAQLLNGYIDNVRIGLKSSYPRAFSTVVSGFIIRIQFAVALIWDARGGAYLELHHPRLRHAGRA